MIVVDELCKCGMIHPSTQQQESEMKYKLNFARDVDTDEPDVYILNLPNGFRFDHDPCAIEHVRAYDTIKEIKDDIKDFVVPCNCKDCVKG